MDDGQEPNRIEIELTSHESTPARRAAIVTESGDSASDRPLSATGSFGDQRSRVVVGGVGLATVALLVGVMVGRMGAGEVATTGPSTSTTVVDVATTRPVPNAGTLPLVEEPAGPTTTSGAPPSTVDPFEVVKGVVTIDPVVASKPIEIVALTGAGKVIRIDAATGLTLTSEVEGSQFGPPSIHAGDGWILVPSYDEQRGSTVVHDDGTRSSLETGTAWPLLAVAETGRFWRADTTADSLNPDRLVEISVDGGVTGNEIETRGFYPRMVDPAGGIVMDAPGGSFAVSPDSVERVTSGRLLAIGRQRAVVQECDDLLECGYFIVDRSSGTRTLLELDDSISGRSTIDSGGWWTIEQPLNDAEDAVLVVVWDQFGTGQQTFGVIDLVDGSFTEIGDSIDVPTMLWAPDGSGVFWLDRGRLRMYDVVSGESLLVSEEIGQLNAFTVRAALPSVDVTETVVTSVPAP